MKKKLLVGAVLLVVAAAATTAVLATIIEDPEDPGTFYVVIQDPPGGGTCNCPMVFAPVLCGPPLDKTAYTNACFAACNGATDCAQIVSHP